MIVQIVAVGDDHDGGVFHGGMQNDPPGVKGHRQAFARTLGVPDHADAMVAGFGVARWMREVMPAAFGNPAAFFQRSPDGLLDRHVDGMELVIARHLLDRADRRRHLQRQ